MSEGPVSEGSIVAYIGADDDDYQEKMRRAQAVAEELGRSDPTVHVDASVGEALTRLDEVAAKTNEVTRAEARLDAAARAAANAASTQYLAELRLAEIQEKGARSGYQLAAAQEAVARASRNAEAAEQRQVAAEIALRAVQATPPGETPTKDAGNGGMSPSRSGGGGVGYYGGWAIGIAAALPVLADLAGAAAADAGAFLGLGAAGITAVAGIKAEMASGSEEGRVYSAIVARLRDDLDSLERTAASGVLTGVEASMQAIDGQMPQLNAEIAGFASGLGTIAGITVDGIVTGFQVLNPLFNTAQAGIKGLAFQWNRWIHDGGLQRWGDDVQRVFPLVTDTIGTLGDAVLKILGDLQPLGTVMLETADGAAHLLQWLASLGPMFPPLALGVVAAVAAFRNFDTIAPILDKVTQGVFDLTGKQAAAEARTLAMNAALAAGASAEDAYAAGMKAVEAASGPAGWVMLAASVAVGVLASGLTAGADAAGAATTALQDYSGAVEQDKGVVGDATQAILAKNLVTSDAIQKAKELGISESQVTEAITSGGSKRAKLLDDLQSIVKAHTRLIESGQGMRTQVQDDQAKTAQAEIDIIKSQSGGIESSISAYQQQASVVGHLADQAQKQITMNGVLGTSYGLTATQIAKATWEQQALAAQTAWAATQLNLENAAAQAFSIQMELMNNSGLNVSLAQTALASATMNATKSFKQNGATLDSNTQSGIANRQSLDQALQAIERVSDAVVKQTGSREQGNKALEDGKQALKNELAALGDLTPAVAAYIDQVKQIPVHIDTNVSMDASGAFATLSALRSQMGNIALGIGSAGGTTAYSTGGTVYRAGGGGVPAYLAGGGGLFEPRGTDTVPAMLTPGEMVIRRKSADYDPQFIRRYNDDPERALAGVRAQSPQPVVQNFHNTNIMHPQASAASFAQELGWVMKHQR
ncbi:hypothetical protein [Microbacterium capsulatum]|uniref:Uncharacterized protein n=1 Tax=Microbacterium capsulatum TaxID=3041921 RepID=A0ABU0XGS5_9MICO|nr:hypothetical protein [Microbacterium sp. ASV81]MDQ4213768.1 hypothetical protein [Microbacterium sp. ASV81]